MFDEAKFSRVPSPLKWHGGKSYLAARLVSLMPRHLHYVEPFAGGLSVLLARDPADESLWPEDHEADRDHRGTSEVVNDLNRQLSNFWRVLADEALFPRFQRKVEAIPLSRVTWDEAGRPDVGDTVEDAACFFVRCRQSLAGRMKHFTAVTRNRTRRGMNGNVSEWLSAVDGLGDVHARLRSVLIECLPATDLIRREDGPLTLFYCDPPYLHETRASPGVYAHEMTEDGHRELLRTLQQCRGKVMLSGYRSELYDRELARWVRHDFDVPNQAAGGREKRRMVECVWCNFSKDAGRGHRPAPSLFA